jgi:hypothetical protein
MSLLLPSLRSAREHAKRVKCQANLRQINTALYEYILDYDDLPIFYLADGAGHITWNTWNYGGWLGRNSWWDDQSGGLPRVPANKRPLTVYMNKGGVAPPKVKNGTLWEEDGQPVFRCPSDRKSGQMRYRQPSTPVNLMFSSYEDVGTSYHMNFYWLRQTHLPAGPDWDGDGQSEPTTGLCPWEPVLGGTAYSRLPSRLRQGRDIWMRHLQRGSSRFVTLVEEPFDLGICAGTQEMGFHGRFSRHVLAFIDGHVAYLTTDTRNKFGPEWTVVDEQLEAP